MLGRSSRGAGAPRRPSRGRRRPATPSRPTRSSSLLYCLMLLSRSLIGGSSLSYNRLVYFCASRHASGRRTPDEGKHDACTVAALSRGGPRTPGDCGPSIYRRRGRLFDKTRFVKNTQIDCKRLPRLNYHSLTPACVGMRSLLGISRRPLRGSQNSWVAAASV